MQHKEVVQLSDGREFDGKAMAALNSALSKPVPAAVESTPEPTPEPAEAEAPADHTAELVALLREQNASLIGQVAQMMAAIASMGAELAALKQGTGGTKPVPVRWVHVHTYDKFDRIDKSTSTAEWGNPK